MFDWRLVTRCCVACGIGSDNSWSRSGLAQEEDQASSLWLPTRPSSRPLTVDDDDRVSVD